MPRCTDGSAALASGGVGARQSQRLCRLSRHGGRPSGCVLTLVVQLGQRLCRRSALHHRHGVRASGNDRSGNDRGIVAIYGRYRRQWAEGSWASGSALRTCS